MSYLLAFHPQVKRQLSTIPPAWHPRLESCLKLVAADPVTYSSRLHSPWKNLYCYSSPPFRLIYILFDREQTLALLALSTQPTS
jgi:mRNA-degrading endonuclease RelE of RelBE toxin-antitoxin system